MIRPTFCTIDLAAAARNYRAIRASLKEGTKMMAVVKADAYGHGSVPISRVALANGADCLAVAIPEEGAAGGGDYRAHRGNRRNCSRGRAPCGAARPDPDGIYERAGASP